MKNTILAIIASDKVKAVQKERDAIDKEHVSTVEDVTRQLDRDAAGANLYATAEKFVAKRAPALFAEMLQAATIRTAVGQEVLSAVFHQSTVRRDAKTAAMHPLVEAALKEVEGKLTADRQAVVDADARRTEDSGVPEVSTNTLALYDRKLEEIRKGFGYLNKASVTYDVRAAINSLFYALEMKEKKPSLGERYLAGELDAVSPGRDERDERAYPLNGVRA